MIMKLKLTRTEDEESAWHLKREYNIITTALSIFFFSEANSADLFLHFAKVKQSMWIFDLYRNYEFPTDLEIPQQIKFRGSKSVLWF